MDHVRSHRTSLAFLATVLVSAGTTAPVAGAAEGGGTIRLARVQPDEPPHQYIAPSEFSIAGICLHGDLATLDRLGMPKALSRGYGEDSGGGYTAAIYHYGGLDVTVVRGRINAVTAKSSGWATPRGLKPGMRRADVLDLLGREPAPEHLNDGVYSFVGCPEWRDGELVWDNVNNLFEFSFGGDGRLSFVRLAAGQP